MLVAVGTANPVKVKAVENVLSQFYDVAVVMKKIPSGVSSQPIGWRPP